jgi:hypothetical protein
VEDVEGSDRQMQQCLLVRYAGDALVLCATWEQARAALGRLRDLLAELGLEPKAAKTPIVHLVEGGEGVDFLGFHHRLVRGRTPRSAHLTFLARWPSRKATQRARDRIREITDRKRLVVPVEDIVKELDGFLRGWAGYFRFGNSARVLPTHRHFSSQQRRHDDHPAMPKGFSALAYLRNRPACRGVPCEVAWSGGAIAGVGPVSRPFTDGARRVVVLAQDEARLLNHNYLGTEHLLLGLIREGEGVAVKALESLGVSLAAVRAQVQEVIGQGQSAPISHIPFTPRAKKVLELSFREALQLNHDYIGTEHLLLGLIGEGEGVAAQVLMQLGADLSRVRQRVIELRSGAAGS